MAAAADCTGRRHLWQAGSLGTRSQCTRRVLEAWRAASARTSGQGAHDGGHCNWICIKHRCSAFLSPTPAGPPPELISSECKCDGANYSTVFLSQAPFQPTTHYSPFLIPLGLLPLASPSSRAHALPSVPAPYPFCPTLSLILAPQPYSSSLFLLLPTYLRLILLRPPASSAHPVSLGPSLPIAPLLPCRHRSPLPSADGPSPPSRRPAGLPSLPSPLPALAPPFPPLVASGPPHAPSRRPPGACRGGG